MTMHNPRKYTRADLTPGAFALVRARGGFGAFVARIDAFPRAARMAVGISLDTGRRVRFSPTRVLGVTADAAEARSESDVRRAARIARRDRVNRQRSEDADQRRIDRFNGSLRALFNVHADALAARALDEDAADDAGMPTAAAAFLAAADYDARHGARSDGLPPSDTDPASGAQYGEAC